LEKLQIQAKGALIAFMPRHTALEERRLLLLAFGQSIRIKLCRFIDQILLLIMGYFAAGRLVSC
jgi:hypothetical protein